LKVYELINSIVAIWNLSLQILKFLTNSHYALTYILDNCQTWITNQDVILVISISRIPKDFMKKIYYPGMENPVE